MRTILFAGNTKNKYMLAILLMMTMIPATAQYTENSIDAQELFFRERNIPVDIPRGFRDPVTGMFHSDPAVIPKGISNPKSGEFIPDPPAVKTQPQEEKITQPSQSTASSESTGIHCEVEFLPLDGSSTWIVNLSKMREFKTGEKIRFYCRSNIDGYLVIFQQQNNGSLNLLYPYKDKGKFIDNQVYTDRLMSIHPQGDCMEFTGDPGEIHLQVIVFTNDGYKELSSASNEEQPYITAVQETIRDEEKKREITISKVPSKPVNSYTTDGFFSAINAPVPVFATEIVLNQLP